MKENIVSVVIVSKDRKKDLIQCIESYLRSSYKPLEIIVVDNASKPSLITWLPKKYPKVKLLTSDTNLGAAGGRNLGIKVAKGEYILFTDDDAYADKDMVKHLVSVFEKNKRAGIVQPLVYDKQKKNMLQGAGHDIDLITGRIKAWGVREEDKGQYEGLREVPMCGCVWMVRREVFEKIGNYDEDYFIPYEDSDFSLRARKVGYKLYCYSPAKTWHQGPKSTYIHPWIEWLGITSPDRAYRVARNKIIFMRKHSPFPNNLFFFFILLPGYTIAHSLIIATPNRFDILAKYWLGVFSGLWYSLTYPFRGLKKIYKELDKKLEPLELLIFSWTEPICWLVDRSAKSLLDVGCGQGLPMQLLRRRRKFKKVVGVDLFEPYIEETRQKGIHDEYVIADARDMDFQPKSFDVVMALQVLEHLPKKDAWKVLEKMEKIARKQVIVSTPIGEMFHPAVDSNPLQLHKSSFLPEEFEKRGYKILKMGRKSFLGEQGIVHKVKNDFLRKLLYGINFLMTPIFYIFQSLADYHCYAYKNFHEK